MKLKERLKSVLLSKENYSKIKLITTLSLREKINFKNREETFSVKSHETVFK